MQNSLKDQLIARYQKREPKHFIQYDGYIRREGEDLFDACSEYFDQDGYSWIQMDTWELMEGAAVRVLIKPETKPEDAARLLKILATQIKKAGRLASPTEPHPEGKGFQKTLRELLEEAKRKGHTNL